MPSFPPEQDDVVVVTSEPDGDEGRRFLLEEDPTDGLDLDVGELRHEDDLVAGMRARGFSLTMVGGGSRSDETRRFYFRSRG